MILAPFESRTDQRRSGCGELRSEVLPEDLAPNSGSGLSSEVNTTAERLKAELADWRAELAALERVAEAEGRRDLLADVARTSQRIEMYERIAAILAVRNTARA
jgi:hypothetical protein